MKEHEQTICLCMIVKDEAAVIGRCLASVRPIIHSWIIVDTGSSDATREIIAESLQGLPGELLDRPWVDFAHNRNEALEYARGRADYILILDADETISLPEGFEMPKLTADAYQVEISYSPYVYFRKQMVRSSLPCRYHGVLHEYLEAEQPHIEEVLPGLRILVRHDGARARDPRTYSRDALVLEKALLEEPENPRYVFYLAQSYRDAGDDELALRYYRRRAPMSGWDEETWHALYQVALLKERSAKSWAEVREDYLTAFEFRPGRAEPLYRIGLHYRARKQHVLAHLFFFRAMQIPFPVQDRLFVEQDIYDYLLALEYAETCSDIGEWETAADITSQILALGRLPLTLAGRVARCRRNALTRLHPGSQATRHLTAIIVADNSGPALNTSIESVLIQELPPLDVIVVVNGNHLEPFPIQQRTEAPPFCVASFDLDCSLADRLGPFVESNSDPDDLVLLLFSPNRLADRHSLSRMVSSFENCDCTLVCESGQTPQLAPERSGTLLFRPRLWSYALNHTLEMTLAEALISSASHEPSSTAFPQEALN